MTIDFSFLLVMFKNFINKTKKIRVKRQAENQL